MSDKKRVKLSRAILDMKFMKKTKERVEKEEDDAEGYAMYSNEISEEMKKNGTIIFLEISIAQCKNLTEGRLSFGGMNPEIEQMMEKENSKQSSKVEKDVTDLAMASTLVDTMGKRFQSKRNRNQNKFLKPNNEF